MSEIIDKIEKAIIDTKNHFDNESHYEYIEDRVLNDEFYTNLYEAGMINGLEMAMRIIKENEAKQKT